MKRSRFLGAFLAVVMLFTCMGGVTVAKAAHLDVAAGTESIVEVYPGQTNHVRLQIRVLAYNLTLNTVNIVPGANSPITISNLVVKDYSNTAMTGVINMYQGGTYYLEFDATVSDSASVGYYDVEVRGSGAVGTDVGFENIGSNESLMDISLYVPYELSPIQLTVNNVNYDTSAVVPGNSFDLVLNIKNEGERKAVSGYLSMSFGESGLVPGYTVETQKLGNLNAAESKNITIPVNVLSTAEEGLKKITVNLTCKDTSGSEESFSRDIYISVGEAGAIEGAPFLTMTTDDNYKQMTPETNDKITVKLTNSGDSTAYNVDLIVKSGFGADVGITKAYTTESLKIDNIEAGETKTIEIPVAVSKALTEGLKELQIEAGYTSDKNIAQKPAGITMYVSGPDTPEAGTTVTVTNVTQSPSRPQAGGQLTVTFKLNNEGEQAITDVKVTGAELSSSGFEPVSSEPYQYVGDIEKGKSKTVTMKFRVGEKITEGLNNLAIEYTFTDVNGEIHTETVKLYILNVENQISSAIGRPKLIINNYETSIAELKAGSEFDLTFVIKNTHQSKAAKNIKITVSQADGVFAATQGSNIFYIDKIEAGNEAENTISLKTRANAETGDYDLVVKVEYEYDDMSDVDVEKGGVSEENTLKLHAVENYRPSVENITIQEWDGVYVNQPVSISFEFYNMGKSTLGNMYATVEGDFSLDNSTKYYMSSVEGYGYQYCDFTVIPLVLGEAKGTLIIHFEDSNGDENTYTQEFSAFVSEQPVIDIGGGEDPSFPVDGGGVDVKEPVMDTWLFIAIQAAVLIIGIAVTYKVRISMAKKKMRKELEAED